MNFEQYIVKEIYTGWGHYQVNGLDYSPEGYILEVSPQEAKCWVLDITELYSHIPLRECLIAGILCSDSYLNNKEGQWIIIGNPIEGALIAAASKAGLYKSNFQRLMPKLDTIRSTPEFQYMATLHSNIDEKTIYIKSTPEKILPCAQKMLDANGNLIDLDIELVALQTESMREDGLQVIAFAKKQVSAEKNFLDRADLESKFVFLGLQGIERFYSSASEQTQI
jgi:Ca2+-transporting ATPase